MRLLLFISLFILPMSLLAETVFIEFVKQPSARALAKVRSVSGVKELKRFDNFNNSYFKRLYQVDIKNYEEVENVLAEILEIKSIEQQHQAELQSIIPAEEKSPLSNDPFFNYQWSMYNNGQVLLKDIDDIHLERLEGISGYDIGWKNLDSKMKRDVVVAVVDSGIDVDHKDIKSNLYKNEAECKRGRIPLKPKEDKDENGYVGDCIGWNFTTNDPRMQNRPKDDVGHGTHVAGIIAAELNNNIGLSGFSNRIKILPIKVTMDESKEKKLSDSKDKKDDGKKKRKKPLSLTDRIAKAILYATKMKVDVINISLGWPHRADTKYLREAFSAALSSGVSIVAAAGNNDNSAQIFPCAYKGVICVGSVNNRGEVSDFSNYGGHVDVLAPGDNILSLHPMAKDTADFSVLGYTIKSGTSQAAPHISAVIAMLKGVNPGASENEVLGRLYSGQVSAKEHPYKFNLSGIVKLEKTLSAKAQAVVRPVFKELDRVIYNKNSMSIQFQLPIKNYWKDSGQIQIKVLSKNPQVKFLKSNYSVSSMTSGERQILNLNAKIISDKAHSLLPFVVEITESRQVSQYKHEVIVSRDIKSDNSVISLPVMGSAEMTSLKTMPVYHNLESFPEYYWIKKSEESLSLNILKKSSSDYSERVKVIVPGGQVFISAVKAELNGDGELDYLVRTVAKKGEERFIQYSYFNGAGQPLFGSNSHFKLDYNGEFGVSQEERRRFFGVENLKFIAWESAVGSIRTPVFFGEGYTPEEDKSKNSLDFETDVYKKRLYAFEPIFSDEENRLKVRTSSNNEFEEQVRTQLQLKFSDSVNLVEVLSPTGEQQEAGELSVLISVGKGFNRLFYKQKINSHLLLAAKTELTQINIDYSNLSGFRSDNLVDLEPTVPNFFSSSTFIGFITETLAQIVSIWDGDSESHSLEQPDKRDWLLDFIKLYKRGSETYSFFVTKSFLMLKVDGPQGEKVIKRPVVRSSFLPGHFFKESLYPITKGGKGPKRPALYVNASQLSSNHIYTWSLEGEDLIAPMDMNIDVPKECRPLNPIRFGEGGEMAYSLYCKKEGQAFLKFLVIQ